MPDRIDKTLFLAGLGVFTLGQLLLNLLGPASQDQVPIDWAHWALILGAALLIPFAARLPRRGLGLLAGPVLIAGVLAVVGMCVIDFIFWSLPADLDRTLYENLSAEPAIWQVFMRWGPNEVFVAGLLLPSLLYFPVSRAGTGLVLAGALTMAVGTHWWNVAGYVLVIAGYALCFGFAPWTRSAPAAPAGG